MLRRPFGKQIRIGRADIDFSNFTFIFKKNRLLFMAV